MDEHNGYWEAHNTTKTHNGGTKSAKYLPGFSEIEKNNFAHPVRNWVVFWPPGGVPYRPLLNSDSGKSARREFGPSRGAPPWRGGKPLARGRAATDLSLAVVTAQTGTSRTGTFRVVQCAGQRTGPTDHRVVRQAPYPGSLAPGHPRCLSLREGRSCVPPFVCVPRTSPFPHTNGAGG